MNIRRMEPRGKNLAISSSHRHEARNVRASIANQAIQPIAKKTIQPNGMENAIMYLEGWRRDRP
jgi:hypothetical protein